jgi:putative transposase
MSQTYVRCLVHLVWSTHGRQPTVVPDLGERLAPYLGGVARAMGAHALAVACLADHAHVLASLPATRTVADIVRELKAGSSRFAHQCGVQDLRWQDGYAAFSVGASGRARVEAYIRGQEEHHRTATFKEELLDFLERNGVEYDPRYIWR